MHTMPSSSFDTRFSDFSENASSFHKSVRTARCPGQRAEHHPSVSNTENAAPSRPNHHRSTSVTLARSQDFTSSRSIARIHAVTYAGSRYDFLSVFPIRLPSIHRQARTPKGSPPRLPRTIRRPRRQSRGPQSDLGQSRRRALETTATSPTGRCEISSRSRSSSLASARKQCRGPNQSKGEES